MILTTTTGQTLTSPNPKRQLPKRPPLQKHQKPQSQLQRKRLQKRRRALGRKTTLQSQKKPKAAPKKKKNFDSDDMSGSDFDISNMEPARDRPGRGKKTVNYGGGDSGSGSDSDF